MCAKPCAKHPRHGCVTTLNGQLRKPGHRQAETLGQVRTAGEFLWSPLGLAHSAPHCSVSYHSDPCLIGQHEPCCLCPAVRAWRSGTCPHLLFGLAQNQVPLAPTGYLLVALLPHLFTDGVVLEVRMPWLPSGSFRSNEGVTHRAPK